MFLLIFCTGLYFYPVYFSGNVVYTEESTQQSMGSFGSENLNDDSNMSFPENSEHSEHNDNTEYSHDSNDADPQMRVGKCCVTKSKKPYLTVLCNYFLILICIM